MTIRNSVLATVPRLLLLGLLALVGLGTLSGCGYTLVGLASNIPEDVRTVYVEPLENRTSRAQVEQVLSRAIIDELVTRRRFEVVTSPAGADARLHGAVVGYTTAPVGFGGDGRATEYEISLTAQVIFQRIDPADPNGGAVIWRNDRYLFRQAYQLDLSEAGYFDREDETITELAERFAETMVTDLLEGF